MEAVGSPTSGIPAPKKGERPPGSHGCPQAKASRSGGPTSIHESKNDLSGDDEVKIGDEYEDYEYQQKSQGILDTNKDIELDRKQKFFQDV